MLQGEHSAILSTFIQLPFVITIFVLSIFEWLLKTGFTVIFHRKTPQDVGKCLFKWFWSHDQDVRVICNSKGFYSFLLKLCIMNVHVLKMCTSHFVFSHYLTGVQLTQFSSKKCRGGVVWFV